MLLGSTAASSLADGVIKLTLPLAAAGLGASVGTVALVVALNSLPWLFFSLVAGVIADRVDRRNAVVRLGLVRVFVATGLACWLVWAADGNALIGVFIAAWTLGVLEVFIDTIRMPLAASVVPRERLEWGYGRLTAVEIVSNEFVGPPVGGLLLGLSAIVSVAFGAVGFLLGTVMLLGLHGTFTPARIDRALATSSNSYVGDPCTDSAAAKVQPGLAHQAWRDVVDGVRFMRTQPMLLALVAAAGIASAGWAGWLALMPSYVLSGSLGNIGASGYGLLVGGLGVGGLAGALSADWLRRRVGRWPLMFSSLLVAAMLAGAPAVSSDVAVVAFGTVLGGFGAGCWNVAYSSLRALLVPDELMGRYSGASRLITFGAMPVGAAVAGAIAQLWGPGWSFTVLAILMASSTIALLLGGRHR